MRPLGYGYSLVHLGAKVNYDYSEIIRYLNLLTDTEDAIYKGKNPTIEVMNATLNTINGETI